MKPTHDSNNRKIDLILRYLSNDCDERQVEELSQLLRVDAGAREDLLQISMHALAVSELASAPAWDAESYALDTKEPDIRSVSPVLRWTSFAIGSAFACGAIVLGILYFRPSPVQKSVVGSAQSVDSSAKKAPSLEIEGIHDDKAIEDRTYPALIRLNDFFGQVIWKGTDGHVLKVGSSRDTLGEGTIILETETSYLEFEFPDGTRAMLKGVSELSISGEQQKRLNLRMGNLLVEAVSQPVELPMVVRTPNSENTVVGTRFELTVENGTTALAVDEGQVQLRRLRDGVTINVGKSEVVLVGEDATDQELRRSRFPSVPFRWIQSFDRMPSSSSWYGDWIPPDDTTPGLLRAVPRRVGENDDNGMEYHYRISSLSASGPYVCISPESVVRLTYRTEQESNMELFIGLKQLNREFGGNFVFAFDTSKTSENRTENRWQTIEIPIQRMRAMSAKRARIPNLSLLSFVYVSSLGKDIGLEISRIEIVTPESGPQ